MLLNINSLILIITFAIDLGIAVYLVIKDRKNASNLTFSSVIICMALWAVSYVFWASASDPFWIKLWINLGFFATAVMPAFFLYFSIVYPKKEFTTSKLKLVSIFLPAAIFAIASFTDLLAKGIAAPFVEPVHGDWYLMFVIYIICFLMYAFISIFRKYLGSTGKEKAQIQYLLLGSLITAMVGIFANVFLVSQGTSSLGPIMINTIGPASTLIMIGFITFSMVRHDLINIDDLLTIGTLLITVVLLVVGTVIIVTAHASQFLFPFYAILVNISLGFYILFQNRYGEMNRAFFLLCLCLAVFIYSTFRIVSATLISECLFWWKIAFIGPIIIPALFLYFTSVFPRRTVILPFNRQVMIIAAATLIMLMLFSDLIIVNVDATAAGLKPVYGPGYTFFLVYFISFIAYSLINLFNKYSGSVGIEKMQIRYLFMGLFMTAILGSLTSLIAPLLGETRFIVFGPIFTLILLGMTAYAIGVRRLLSIEFMMQRGAVHVFMALLLSLIYISAGYLSGVKGIELVQNRQFAMFFLFAIFASFIYIPAHKMLQLVFDRVLYGVRYDYQKVLLNISHGITSVIKMNELIELIISTFLDAIKVREISMLLFDEAKNKFKSVPCELKTEGKYKRIEFGVNSTIVTWIKLNRDVLVRDEIEGDIDRHSFMPSEAEKAKALKELRDELERLEMAVWVPVIFKDRLMALIALGYKQSGDMYTDEDIGLLTTLANQVAVALENSMMYSTIEKQYEELKLTKDKLSHADKLASLGTMAAGMAHEIKNPLSSMKVFSQLLHDRYEDPEFRKKFEEIIPQEINRVDRIVEGLLSFAKLPEPKISRFKIDEVIDNVLAEMNNQIEAGGVKVTKIFKALPDIEADKEQIKKVFMNVILNAVQAMPKGGRLAMETELVEQPERTLRVKVTDNGVGISKDNMKHVFDPFFTTKHFGTGLGLAITHSIMIAHKGNIEIESKQDEGTTVSLTLPAI